MATLRQDPTTRQWAILAPQRADRPHDPVVVPRPVLAERDPDCPFCPGNEDRTPPEVARVGDGEGWRVRVIPNLFAALSGDGSARRRGDPLHREMAGIGSHEVVVEAPNHDARLDEMDQKQVGRIIEAWRARYRDLIAQPHVRAVLVFKNFGRLAGTSLVHSHSQIVATPVFLPRLLRRMDVATRYFDDTGSCVYDDVIAAERSSGERVVEEYGGFISLEPWAAGSPFETWIAPAFHQGSFGDIADEEIDDLAGILIRTLSALRRACDDPDFNLVMYSAPVNGGHAERVFHWHLKLIPKLATPAGFELGSAMSINTVSPEDAAARLRAALRG